MTSHPHILFNKTPEQLRRVGSRGGKARARNHRTSMASQYLALADAPPSVQQETTADAIAALDRQFSWLRGVEKRSTRVPAPQPRAA